MLRDVTFTDGEGRRWLRRIPETAPDSDAERGVPVGPPSLAELNLPLATEVRLHNELFDRGIMTENDAKRRKSELVGAVMAAFKVDAGRLVDLYIDGSGA